MMKASEINITKASGEKSKFSEARLRRSLEKAGASPEQTDAITEAVSAKLFEGITTKKIYSLAFKLLKSGSRSTAARYHLKQAIMELGPSGFPFEKYIGSILSHQGYKTKTGQFLQGQCVMHEIDVIAEKENNFFVVECKYHNQRGIFCDVKVPLYIQSRFKDVETQLIKVHAHQNINHQGWVVTNTRFSVDAIQYGTCIGLKLIGWDYPVNGSLKDQIDELGLYPITCLTSLTKVEKQRLLDEKIVLCKELPENQKLLVRMGIKPQRINTILKETQQLCLQLVS